MTTTAVVTKGEVTGNIGSCQVNKTSVNVSSSYVQTIAINSCTGEVVADNTYYDWGYVYIPLAIVFIVVAIFVSIVGLAKLVE